MSGAVQGYSIIILASIWCPAVPYDFDSSINILTSEEISKNKESHDAVSRNSAQTKYCRKPATCEKLKYTTCFGVRLPYTSTSLTYVPDVENQEDVQKKLLKWKGLLHIPRCWSVIQPFLCALYMPKCANDSVDLPSKEMCETIQSPCSILRTDELWPLEFRCNASYESTCANDVRDLKFNIAGECKPPLTKAIDEASFYEGVEGCGVQCHDPFFTDEERQNIRTTIKWGFTVSSICNGFAVVTYLLTRPFASKFPAQAVFWINLCFFFVSLGFMWQFLGSNDRTICHADGTLRTSEPSRENLSCVTNFIVVYSFLVAGIMWCIIFAYTWLIRSQTYDKIKNRRDKWSAYYHTVSWSIPSVLTVIIAALQQVDGDGLLGICFVGVINKDMRLIFVLGPLLVLIIACVFLGVCIFKLVYLKRTSKEVMSKRAKKKIRESIYKLTLFLLVIIVFMSTTCYCQYYEWSHYHLWKKSFKSYVVCQLGVVGDVTVEDCRMQNRPNVSLVQLQLWVICMFSISVAAWIFTACSTLQTWKRFINETLLKKEVEETMKLKKYKLIARAYEKRKCLDSDGLNSDGAMSIDIRRSHQDPVDLDFDLNSVGSNESTSWAKIIPQLMKRRVAIIPASQSHSNSGQWRNSTDSEISYSVRRVSVESRRHSLDSTVSVQAVEFTETVHKRPRSKRRRKHRKRTQSCSPDISSKRNNSNNLFQDNDLEAEVLKALKIGTGIFRVQQQPSGVPNMNRRMAIPDIEKNSLKLLNLGRKMLDEQMRNDSQSSSGSQTLVSGRSKSDKSEAGSDTNSLQENAEPIKV